MWGHFLLRRLPLCLLILFFAVGSSCWADGVIAGAIVENRSSPSRSADAGEYFAGRSGIVEKLGSGADKSRADTTWSQGLALGVNGPIPAIVVDQFGYPTKASKIAVIRDPKVGYDNAPPISPQELPMPSLISPPGRLQNRARQFLGMAAPRMTCQATESGGLISPMSQLPEPTQSSILPRDCAPPNSKSMIGFTEMS
jgi:hypothetical protein